MEARTACEVASAMTATDAAIPIPVQHHAAVAAGAVKPRRYNLTGRTFGALTCVRPVFSTRAAWLCRCQCGSTTIVYTNKLRSGWTKSCGCRRKRRGMESPRFVHGCSPKTGPKTHEYYSWQGMLRRCYNKKNPKYHRYGGRGIIVCARWRRSFTTFLADVGHAPSARHTIERRNNNGDYRPGNVGWATQKEQQRNRSTNRVLHVDGEAAPLSAWAERSGVGRSTIAARIDRWGWSAKKAVFTPARSSGVHV